MSHPNDYPSNTPHATQPDTPATVATHESDAPHLPEEKTEHPVLEIIRFSIIALLIVIPVRMFVAQPFIVSGASMDNTFHSGQYLIVDQISYHFGAPERGDVIIFRYPKDPSKFFIKRVIGVPGDKISVINDTVTITNDEQPDGWVLNEPYIKSMRGANDVTETLGNREYFVMGDNRDESSDSRAWGLVQEDQIVGRAFLRLFPPISLGIFPGATTITGHQPSS